MVRITKNPGGPQLFIRGWRCHHFDAGVACLAIGIALIALDKEDFLDWLINARR